MNNGRARSSPADDPAGVGTLAGTGGPGAFDDRDRAGTSDRGGQVLWRRRLRHDIRHELGTIIMLASAVVVAEDVGETSRARIDQLLGETRWLDHLLRRLDEDDDDQPLPSPERIRVDELTVEVVTGMRLATAHEVCFTGTEAWAHMDPVALWRAVRNVLDNACRVAAGRVNVGVEAGRGWVVIQVDDDGPGFGAGWGRARPGLASLGLGIVHDLISGYGGSLEIRTCEMGGARVRMLLPAAPPPDEAAGVLTDTGADDWRPHP
ncbi:MULTISPECIES: sensor histidine kinase [Actinomadura]|uniref:histidine kinase n=1 Tax=Actinomadura madurae TaxID=1993 RepID=A0A1I5CPH6_9ACTN|nr:ATP-binding protein [Actinomadura madurae]SFN88910.1 Histidine kinase-, DNA gyrase B-, and HSP90-like ATPase [Actinomadura madurae]SPT50633.1 Osmolarity sensor protein EnvZ [Actinomadura madurae]